MSYYSYAICVPRIESVDLNLLAPLNALLEEFADERFPAVADGASGPGRPRQAKAGAPAPKVAPAHGLPVHWAHGGVPLDNFTGREEELGRLDRWAADPEVKLVGVTAWGGMSCRSSLAWSMAPSATRLAASGMR